MCPQWKDPVEERPPDALEMLDRAAGLLQQDLQRTLDPRIECSAFLKGEGFYVRAVWPPLIRQDLCLWPVWDEAITIARVVEGLQESDFFDFTVDPWPRCALHPDSTHSMTVRRFRTGAWWICPDTGKRTAPVGSLATSSHQL
jgi:hypothetical protein